MMSQPSRTMAVAPRRANDRDRAHHLTRGAEMNDDTPWRRLERDGHTKVDLRIADRLRDYYDIGIMAELLALRAIPFAVRGGGVVPLNSLDELGRDIPRLKRCIAELVAAGVWAETEWGWSMDVGTSRHCRRKSDDRWKLTPELRDAVLERDGNRCQACGVSEPLVIDHVVPVAKGGKTAYENLQALCPWCNGSKGTRSWENFLESLVR